MEAVPSPKPPQVGLGGLGNQPEAAHYSAYMLKGVALMTALQPEGRQSNADTNVPRENQFLSSVDGRKTTVGGAASVQATHDQFDPENHIEEEGDTHDADIAFDAHEVYTTAITKDQSQQSDANQDQQIADTQTCQFYSNQGCIKTRLPTCSRQSKLEGENEGMPQEDQETSSSCAPGRSVGQA